jgi:hypothetical protein
MASTFPAVRCAPRTTRKRAELTRAVHTVAAFHTIHLFGGGKARRTLERMPEADLTARSAAPATRQSIAAVAAAEQTRTGMDDFMAVGERVLGLSSPPVEASAQPAAVPVASATDLAWQRADGGVVGQSALKSDLEALLRRRFASPADYKATAEHWVRIGGALALLGWCLLGWSHGALPETLLLPFAQWYALGDATAERATTAVPRASAPQPRDAASRRRLAWSRACGGASFAGWSSLRRSMRRRTPRSRPNHGSTTPPPSAASHTFTTRTSGGRSSACTQGSR